MSETSKSHGPVLGTRDNVVFCHFGAQGVPDDESTAVPDEDTGMGELVAAIRDAAAEMNAAGAEALAAHATGTTSENDIACLLLEALNGVDNIAFQSRLFAAGGDAAPHTDTAFITASVYRFARAGATLSRKLRALLAERASRSSREARALRALVHQASYLEAAVCGSIAAMQADTRDAGKPV